MVHFWFVWAKKLKCFVSLAFKIFLVFSNNTNFWAVSVPQLTARSLLITEDPGSNPVISILLNNYLLLTVCIKDEHSKEKLTFNGHESHHITTTLLS